MTASRASIRTTFICQRCFHSARARNPQMDAEWRKYDRDRYYSYLIDSSSIRDEQLERAEQFFTRSTKQFLLTTPRFHALPSSEVPEVAFIGRSNVGKSSLINALLGTTKTAKHVELARTSRRAGKTKFLSAYGLGDVRVVNKGMTGQADERGERKFESWSASGPALIVLDTPGYGHASVASWGEAVIKYLVARKQLRQTFVLISAQDGIKSSDVQMLELLAEHAVPFQLVLSKFDRVLFPEPRKHTAQQLPYGRKLLLNCLDEAGKYGGKALIRNIYGCSSEAAASPDKPSKIGVAGLRVAIMKVTGLETGGSMDMPQRRSLSVI